ncbi:hypothetical protein CRENBAI_002092 [Crenichthys baileyi]|uniref:Uncharacterized protein n=1 Tax=Crenichthys baileyi TaxID=28760 RepID=A0AAV9RCK7_9TELE
MARNIDDSKEFDVSLGIFQSPSERDKPESGEESQLSSDSRAQVLQRTDGHPVQPEASFAGCWSTAGSICMNHTAPPGNRTSSGSRLSILGYRPECRETLEASTPFVGGCGVCLSVEQQFVFFLQSILVFVIMHEL